MRADRFLRLTLLVLGCAALLAGCAGKLPKTVPLAPAEEQAARTLWRDFVAGPRPQALDADLRLQWDVPGSKGAVAASLLAQRPALLRVTATDPLGRTLILAVADASSFTMVDNRIGHVCQGTVQSRFWRSYVPAAIKPEDLLPLLGGFLAQGEGDAAAPSQDEAGRGNWYQWRDGNQEQYVLLDKESGTMLQRLLIDGRGDRVLVLEYADYGKDNGFVWPGRVRITGKAVTGALTVRVERIFSHAPKAAAAFRVTPPPHFTVEQVL